MNKYKVIYERIVENPYKPIINKENPRISEFRLTYYAHSEEELYKIIDNELLRLNRNPFKVIKLGGVKKYDS